MKINGVRGFVPSGAVVDPLWKSAKMELRVGFEQSSAE